MSTMDFFTAMEVPASGLSAERTRMNVAASNLANAQTTQAAGGGPYKRRDVVLQPVDVPGVSGSPFAQSIKGVAVSQIAQDAAPPRLEYDPGHPQAATETTAGALRERTRQLRTAEKVLDRVERHREQRESRAEQRRTDDLTARRRPCE